MLIFLILCSLILVVIHPQIWNAFKANPPLNALIIGVHPPDDANWRERKFSKKVRDRFGLPVTEVVIDRHGNVISVTNE